MMTTTVVANIQDGSIHTAFFRALSEEVQGRNVLLCTLSPFCCKHLSPPASPMLCVYCEKERQNTRSYSVLFSPFFYRMYNIDDEQKDPMIKERGDGICPHSLCRLVILILSPFPLSRSRDRKELEASLFVIFSVLFVTMDLFPLLSPFCPLPLTPASSSLLHSKRSKEIEKHFPSLPFERSVETSHRNTCTPC